MNSQKFQSLSRDDVINAVEKKNPVRVPMVLATWWGEGLVEQYGSRLQLLNEYPGDVELLWVNPLDVGLMDLSWKIKDSKAKDSSSIIDDWAKLDEFIEKIPDPQKNPVFDELYQNALEIRKRDKYIMFAWWHLFFERSWKLRGMENILMDYYINEESVHKLHDALSDLYCKYINFAVEIIQPDGFFTSDDLGHQTQSMMRVEMFDKFIKPYYTQVGNCLKENNIHWWLHSCGNNTELLPALIEAGVTVFHPVQKGTMDEIKIAQEYGDKLTFLAGIDVQHILQECSPERVREEVRFLIDTFDRKEGGMCIAAGNGIVRNTPFENIHAFLDEAYRYGEYHRSIQNNQ